MKNKKKILPNCSTPISLLLLITYMSLLTLCAVLASGSTGCYAESLSFNSAKTRLSEGRYYRKDFPEKDGWNVIRFKYHPIDKPEESYVYYNIFFDAIRDFSQLMGDTEFEDNKRDIELGLTESVNEIIMGQTLYANKLLVDALRIRYPRAEDINAPRLPEPPSAREETGALELTILEFRLGLRPAFRYLREYPHIFRSRGNAYPGFPQYTTCEDTSIWPPQNSDGAAPKKPLKNEFAQLTNALARKSLASVEIGKRLFNISTRDIHARDDAIKELKCGSQEAYLGSVILAACQNHDDFSMNGGENLMIHVRNAQDLFKTIKSGLTPLGDDGKYIPNESVQGIYQDAVDVIAEAREAEINARNEDRLYDQLESALRTELQNQRSYYMTPLNNKTGLDPALYNDLHTMADRKAYVAEIEQRVDKLLNQNNSETGNRSLGDLGIQILNIKDAMLCIEEAYNELQNIPKRIEIEQEKTGEIVKVQFDSMEKLQALDIARGYAQSYRKIKTFNFGWSDRLGVSTTSLTGFLYERTIHFGEEFCITYDPTFITLSYLNNEERYINMIQTAEIESINSEAVIRGILLDLGNKALELQRAQNRLTQEKVKLGLMIDEINRMIDDLWNVRASAEKLYFYDPAYLVIVSETHERAAAELEYGIDKLYRLAKTLEYHWVEPYSNPVVVPAECREPASLENRLFDNFTETDDLFGVRTADEAKDFLDALKAWDSKLRRFNVTAVRGPNHSGPLTNKDISLREDILGFKTGNGMLSQSESIRLFQDFISAHRVENPYNPDNPNLEFAFATTVEDNRFFPAMHGRWNMRIESIRMDIYGNSGVNTTWGVAQLELIQSGTVTFRNYWGNPPYDDYLVAYNIQLGERPDWSIFKCTLPASFNGQTAGIPEAEFWSKQLEGRSVAATNWFFKIDTNINENRNIDFSKIKDIIIKIKYTYGNPPEFGI